MARASSSARSRRAALQWPEIWAKSAFSPTSGAECSDFCSVCCKRHQLARAHLAQRNAGGDALHVAAALEFGAQACQWLVPARSVQRGDGGQALAGLACGRAGASSQP
jgi:hypothetical protein